MKSAYLISPQNIQIKETLDPICSNNGLVLKVEICSICGSDVRRWKEGPADKPYVQGHEVSGTVIEIGENVKKYKVGDRLAIAPDIHCGNCYYCDHGLYNLCDNLKLIGITQGYDGGFAEKLLLTDEILSNGIVNKIPDNLSFEEGAIAEICCSSLATLKKVNVSIGQTVVIIGAGPTGVLMTMLAKAMGAKVIVIQRSEFRKKMVSEFGPDLVLSSNENIEEKISEFTNGIFADTVICANPNPETHELGVQITRKGGKVVLFGGLPKSSPYTKLNSNTIHYGEKEIIGAFSYHPNIHKEVLEIFSRKTIDAKKVITHRFNLEDINEAFKTVADGKGLKVLINPSLNK